MSCLSMAVHCDFQVLPSTLTCWAPADLDHGEDMSDGECRSLEDWEDSDSEEDIDLDEGYELVNRWGDANIMPCRDTVQCPY